MLIGPSLLSHVAWQKRLRKAREFLLWLLIQCLAISPRPCPVACQRIVLIDATRLKEPGGTGDDWRVHLGYDLLAGRLLDVKVSDGHTAEGFTLFALQIGDLVVADRGYCRRKQLAYVLQIGAQVVVRLVVHQLPLFDDHDEPLDVLIWLKAQGSGQHSCQVAFEHEGRRFAGRLLALRLSWALVQSQAQQARVVLTAACEQWTHALCQDQRSQAAPPAAASSPMTVSSWAVTALAVATLRLLVQASWTFAHLRECLPDLQRFLCSRRRQRDHQESTIRRRFLAHPGLTGAPASLFVCSSA